MKAIIEIMATLSDAKIELQIAETREQKHSAGQKLEFAKFLLLMYPNTEVEITKEELKNHWENFSN